MNFILPFTYQWVILKKIRESKIDTILELGCGKGDFGDLVNFKNEYKITGVDIFKPYLNISKKKGKYVKIIQADLTKKNIFEKNSFDAVVCLQTIEHLEERSSEQLIQNMEKIARKLVIITTPVGECNQEEYDSNIYQKHLSSWNPKIFIKRGYKVYGVGLKIVYGSHSHMGEKLSKIKIPLYLFSFILNPLTNFFPSIACQMIATKKIDEV